MSLFARPVFAGMAALTMHLSATTACAAPAKALYAVGPFYEENRVYRLDTATGEASLVGTSGQNMLAGLSANADGRLLATRASDHRELYLYEIDTATGLASPRSGNMPPAILYEGAFAIDADTGHAYVTAMHDLYQVNLANGDINRLGALTFDGSPLGEFANIDGLEFRASQLYAIVSVGDPDLNNHLVTIDPETLAIADIGPTGLNLTGTAGLAYDPDTDAFYLAGRGLAGLYRINPQTAQSILIAPLDLTDISGLAFANAPIPEPATPLLLTVAALAFVTRRRI